MTKFLTRVGTGSPLGLVDTVFLVLGGMLLVVGLLYGGIVGALLDLGGVAVLLYTARMIHHRIRGKLRISKTANGTIVVACKACGFNNPFQQPYPYHAGFGNSGFLYNDAGDLTLVWSSFDDKYTALVGDVHPWVLSSRQRAVFEESLLPAPRGGSWRFTNPARCSRCGEPLSGPITDTIYFLFSDGSVNTEKGQSGNSKLSLWLKASA